MGKYSLITVTETHPDEKISGWWVQDKNGVELEEAIEWAKRTSEVNGGADIAVVDQINSTRPDLAGVFTNLIRLG